MKSLPKSTRIPHDQNSSSLQSLSDDDDSPLTNNLINEITPNITIKQQPTSQNETPNTEDILSFNELYKKSMNDSISRRKYVIISIVPLYLCVLLGIIVPHIIGRL